MLFRKQASFASLSNDAPPFCYFEVFFEYSTFKSRGNSGKKKKRYAQVGLHLNLSTLTILLLRRSIPQNAGTLKYLLQMLGVYKVIPYIPA